MTEKRLSINGIEWEYTTGGRGERALLMFHGAVGGAEGMEWMADAFAGECRTVAPTVAGVRRLEEVCDAASAILDREHIGRAVVYGGSFGGMVAQAFARRHPRQVEHLILLSTDVPDPSLGAKNEKLLRILSFLPFSLMRGLLKLETNRHLDAPVPPEAAERVRLVRERLSDYFDRKLTKEVLLSRVALSVDFYKNESYGPADMDDWPGRVLIIESANDPSTNNTEQRRRLRELYPRALVCTFADAGHMIPLLRPDELVGVVRAFVNESYARPEELEHCHVHDEG